MQKIVVVLFVMLNLVQQLVLAQDIMTIGQVFDYSAGDVFEYTRHGGNPPPNATRITITEKYFINDTVFYARFNQSYNSYVVWNPDPHLEYSFYSSYDTISYTNLDSLILFYDALFQEDTTIYFSDQYCGILINAHLGEIGGPFEPHLQDTEYGKGLGVVNLYEAWADNSYEPYGFYMTYYKKGDVECGTIDPLVTSIIDLQKSTINFTIFPNPANTQLSILQTAIGTVVGSKQSGITIYDAQGQLVQQLSLDIYRDVNYQLSIDISQYTPGLYYLHLQSNEGTAVKKFEVIR
jgi:hypothetical protein